MILSYLKTPVFVRFYEKPEFLKRCVLGERFRWIRVDDRPDWRKKSPLSKTKTDTSGQDLQVMLHETIRNDDFKRNTALQRWNNVGTIRNNVATILQSFVALKIMVANRPV